MKLPGREFMARRPFYGRLKTLPLCHVLPGSQPAMPHLREREACNHCLQRIIACRPCGGRGWTSSPTSHHRQACQVCNKTGRLLACGDFEGGFIQYGIYWEQLECGSCSGNGRSLCTSCGGHIWIRRFLCLCTGDILANQRQSHEAPTSMGKGML